MPGPPPPSASYNLKIVDSSDEEDDSEEEEWKDAHSDLPTAMPLLEESPNNTVASTSPPKKKKKKKNRNKNKKKKKPTDRKISFHEVTVHTFERCLGTDVVPYDGGWPLGLADKESTTSMKVDEYEAHKQDKLRIRALERGLENSKEDTQLETRQWDYKRKVKNPLFHLLQEEQRMELLLKASTPEEDPAVEDTNMDCSSNHSSPTKKKDSKNHSTRSRSGSFSKESKNNHPNGKHHPNKHGHTTRSRSGSFSNNTRSRSGSFSNNGERYNDTYDQVQVHHVRNELEELRFQRTGEGHVGCQCRKLDVYLGGGAGKKASKRRMKLLRVKEELKKRHLLPTAHCSREELEVILHNAVEKEGCCSNQDCPCVRNNIGCQADVCNCWHDSHQTNKHDHHDVEVEEMQARCGNREGMYATDLTQIQTMRQQILKNLVENGTVVCCPPVSPHTPSIVD